MILLDYNGIVVGTIISQKLELKEDLIRHVILNQVRQYRTMFKEKYGEIVVCADGPHSWRRDVFPQYKQKRRENRKKDSTDWNEVFRILDTVRQELLDYFPYKGLKFDNCEADDIIGVLVEHSQELGNYEPIMIVSADKDFIQLHKYDNVDQYSYVTKKEVKDPNPRLYLETQILKGDSIDGIPNVLSDDNCLIEGRRQHPLRQKRIDEILTDLSEGELLYAASWYRNYQRNKKLIDLSETPERLKKIIIDSYMEQDNWTNKGKVFPYMVDKQLKNLMENVTEFV